MRDLHWRNIWSSDNPLEVLNEHLFLLVGRYVPTKIILVRNKDTPWFYDQCGRAFDLKHEAHLRWTLDRSRVNWEEFVLRQVRANKTYSEAKHQFSVRNIDVLMNVQSLRKWLCTLKSAVVKIYSEAKHQFSVRNIDVLMNVQSLRKWWCTLKSAVFGSGSSLPPLVGPSGGLVRESVGKADLLSDHFDNKQSRESVDLLVTCHPSPSLITVDFKLSEVKHILFDFYPYGGTDPLGLFPLF